MPTVPYYQNQNFFAPQFQIKLQGQNLGNEVIRDVLEVSYKDDLIALDSFEFTLNDWDAVAREPKYSSPYDASGNLRQIAGTSYNVPSFEPGAQVELYMGYYGAEEPKRMMVGQIVSITPNFPASGNPTLRVRALNLLYKLQRQQETIVYGADEAKKDSEIAEDIGQRLGIEVEIPAGQKDNETPNGYVIINNTYPILFLLKRARERGYDLYVKLEEGDETEKLFFGRQSASDTVYEMEWGKSLIQFSPTLKTRGQVAKVTVRGWDPTKTGNDRSIVGEATWDSLGIEMPDPQLLAQIEPALAQSHEEIVDQVIPNQQRADELAAGILRSITQGLITGRGSTVGFPELRAGRRVRINGLGLRYSGDYRITETTHTIGPAGYTTQFNARMEVIHD